YCFILSFDYFSVFIISCVFFFILFFFFFNYTATTEIYTLSLHDALPICRISDWICRALSFHNRGSFGTAVKSCLDIDCSQQRKRDRKSTRLNSSHGSISYAVFCLKKKKKKNKKKEQIKYVSITNLNRIQQ